MLTVREMVVTMVETGKPAVWRETKVIDPITGERKVRVTVSQFAVIDAGEAPKAPSGKQGPTKEQQEFDKYVKAVLDKPNAVGMITPSDEKDDDGNAVETTRSVKVRVNWAAKRANKEAKSWEADGKVYFKLSDKKAEAKKEETAKEETATKSGNAAKAS